MEEQIQYRKKILKLYDDTHHFLDQEFAVKFHVNYKT